VQPSYDKQFVRDWLLQSGWDKNSPPPELPHEIVEKTAERYERAFQLLTGKKFYNPLDC
jgi:phosphoribosylaminoimidazole-succinocarboxamide synthase